LIFEVVNNFVLFWEFKLGKTTLKATYRVNSKSSSGFLLRVGLSYLSPFKDRIAEKLLEDQALKPWPGPDLQRKS